VGSFEEGKEFDALLVDVNAEGGPFDIFDGDTIEDQFEKFINLGDDRNIIEVYVQGVMVKQGDVFLGELEQRIVTVCRTVVP
jgi:guanine deaminase